MNGVARLFITSAVSFFIAGIIVGLYMAINLDRTQHVTHAHGLVLGWVSLALMGFFYHNFPTLNGSILAKIQFWITTAGATILFVSLIFLYSNFPSAETGAIIGSNSYAVGALIFAFNAIRAMWRS